MELVSIFGLSFTIALTGALAPGPLLTLAIAESFKYGRKAGPIIIGGHALLEIIMVCILVIGLGKILNNQVVIKYISLAGALILIYFGINILRSLSKVSLNVSMKNSNSYIILFFQGITMSIANPYWTVWWLTVGLGLLLSVRNIGIKGLIYFFMGHILADLVWYSFVSYSIEKSKKIISQKVYIKILNICGIILILFGLYFGITSLI
ncbi:MAG: LysE family translocator [bacterium]|nr:LysE family translocator [bacterium]